MSSTDELHRTTGPQPTRRGLLKAGAGAGAAAVAGPAATRNSEAIAPVVVAGLVAYGAGVGVAGATVGWALRDAEILGSDSPSEGLTAGVLEEQIYQMARKRQSNNRTTFLDNQNILQNIDHAAYGDGKLAAIEAINNGKTESEVTQAAQDAATAHQGTVEKNLLNSWNESVNELYNQVTAAQDHSNLSAVSTMYVWNHDYNDGNNDNWESMSTRTQTLADGTEMDINRVKFTGGYYETGSGSTSNTYTLEYDPVNSSGYQDPGFYVQVETASGNLRYLDELEWAGIWDDIQTIFDDVRNELSLWVSNIYGDVQAGDLDTEDLLTSRELAEMTADDEQFNQAVADLMALNIPVDLEREAELSLSDVDGTIYGQLATTSAVTINAGDTIDPSADDVDYYFTYDLSEGHGSWSAYESGIDGGVLTFTSEPYPETLYQIETSAGDTAEVHSDDFSYDESNNVWTVDLSGKLEDSITSVESLTYYAAVEETQYETVQLRQTFTVESITDSDGNEQDQISTSPGSEPHDDTNYITEDEWNQMEQNQLELIERFEQSTGSGFLDFQDAGLREVIAAIAAIVGISFVLDN